MPDDDQPVVHLRSRQYLLLVGFALRLPIFVILFVSFFGGPLLVPLIVLATVTAYLLVFDKPDLVGSPPEAQTTTAPGG